MHPNGRLRHAQQQPVVIPTTASRAAPTTASRAAPTTAPTTALGAAPNMPRRSHSQLWFAALLTSTFAFGMGGCAGCDDATDPPEPASSSSGVGGGGGSGGAIDPGPPTSPTANVRFKSGKRMQRELARALSLAPAQLCRELGQYECFGIHTVVLGEAEAFGIGLFEPLPQTSAVTPLAVERVVLSGCTQRAMADFDLPESAVVFKGFSVDAAGRLTDAEDGTLDAAVTELYRRGLSRDPKAAELTPLVDFYAAIEAEGSSPHFARDWATLSCFSVLTTMEAVFY